MGNDAKAAVNLLGMLVNTTRRMSAMFPGFFQTDAKHKHYADYGWPEQLQFEHFYQLYRRHGIGHAGVTQTVLKTWQDNPRLAESEDATEETALEQEIAARLEELRFWQHLAEADKRSLVGEYAGVILRFADDKELKEPVDAVSGGLDGLVEIIPAWQGQLKVAEWDQDTASETYGQPKMYQFTEASVGSQGGQSRQFPVHPDRVVIWSETGTVHGHSLLEPGFNDLLTLEKVSGAGGEGFWKNAKSAPVLNVDKEAKLRDLATALGVPETEIADKLDEIVGDYQKGFDEVLMLQGIKAETLDVTLPQPEQFYSIALQSFAASIGIPTKILVGSQTGERASTEDAKEWGQTCQSRRVNEVRPNIIAVINRLKKFGVLKDTEWVLVWSDLTESTMAEKIDRAGKMASVNRDMKDFGEVVFSGDEIRETVDLDPIGLEAGEKEDQRIADALAEARAQGGQE